MTGTSSKPLAHGSHRREADTKSFANKNIGAQKEPGKFGRMFPTLEDKPFEAKDADLTKLAEAMVDPQDASSPPDNPDVPAGFTYLGQFVDHDITLDTTSLSEVIEDPLTLRNFRTPGLDLDSLYGLGPGASPQLYDRNSPGKFLIGNTISAQGIPVLPNDLPRSPQGFALIGDHRNDENLLVAQTHLAFLKFHNAVMDHLSKPPNTVPEANRFAEARRLVTWHYQWLVLHDFVERITEKGIVAKIRNEGRKFYRFKSHPFMPIEFSVAAYRLGHSMVRETYSHNRVFGAPGGASVNFDLLFKFTGLSGDINGLPPFPVLPSNWIIDWRRFFAVETPQPVDVPFNLSRPLDPFLAPVLGALPGGAGRLAFLNLKRGVKMKLPSGQDVADFMKKTVKEPVLTSAEIAEGPDGVVAKSLNFHKKTPLWYYILKEAKKRNNGLKLGPYGARIVAEVFVGLVQGGALEDPSASFMSQKNWKPHLPSKVAGDFTMADMLRFVNDLNPIN